MCETMRNIQAKTSVKVAEIYTHTHTHTHLNSAEENINVINQAPKGIMPLWVFLHIKEK